MAESQPPSFDKVGKQASFLVLLLVAHVALGREQSHAVYGCLQDMVIGDGLGSWAQTSPFLAFSE